MKIANKYSFLILALLFVLLSYPVMKKTYEAFENLSPGKYSVSVDKPILYTSYPLKKEPGLSTNTYSDNYEYYPIFGNSYEQHTNNVRYWETPNNGTCSFADMCGGLYEDKKLDIPKSPQVIPFTSPDIRVNFYGSNILDCPSTYM